MAARDAAIPTLLYGSGLRRAEAVGLDIADYDRDAGTHDLRPTHLGEHRVKALS